MKRRRIRWITFLSLFGLLLAALAAYFYSARIVLEPWQLLAQVEQLEKAGARRNSDQTSVQMLGWSLAKLGRDDEVRQMSFNPQLPPSTVPVEKLKLTAVPWRSAIRDIAAKH